jgi:alkaline phosphatase D
MCARPAGAPRYVPLVRVREPISRRRFLGLSAAALAVAACSSGGGRKTAPSTPAPTSTSPPVPRLSADPFTLGVSSGEPAADGFVLWTRLAPEPLAGGGMPRADVPVRWMVGADDALRDIVAEGVEVATRAHGHAVHAVVEGLQPDRPYWYRFVVGDYETPVARTRTFPDAAATPERLRFAVASCQNYRDGYWAAWNDVASDEDLDLVVFLGDYIYESGTEGPARSHDIAEVITLEQYRNRYALYRSDAHLRAAHAVAPWLITWDDHEVDNNYQGRAPEDTSATPDPTEFLERRAAAYKAWWEHMPTRVAPPTSPDLAIYRHTDFGGLARFAVLDTRQYRDDQVCAPSDIGSLCDAARKPDFTLLGSEQERWLADTLESSDATWNVIAQQIVFSKLAFGSGEGAVYNLDQWDGYPASRDRVLGLLRDGPVSNPVVLTGDIHASGVGDVKADFDDPSSAVIGTEFVGTSVSSDADALEPLVDIAVRNNPHVKWAEAMHRGWVRCEVTADAWRAEYRFVEDARVENSPVATAKRWIVEPGRPVEEV